MRKYKMNDTINFEPYNNCLVEDIVYEEGAIFFLIKHYKLNFSDDVLKEANITKTIRDIKYRIS